jgi:hypothetical protein
MLMMAQKMKHTTGERFNIRFNGKIKMEFHGARLTSDGGLLACRELDEALVSSDSAREIDKDWGQVLKHSRYVIFQMAEVAISKEVFAGILSRINRLRCYSHQ